MLIFIFFESFVLSFSFNFKYGFRFECIIEDFNFNFIKPIILGLTRKVILCIVTVSLWDIG